MVSTIVFYSGIIPALQIPLGIFGCISYDLVDNGGESH